MNPPKTIWLLLLITLSASDRRAADWVTFDVGSGTYRFELKGK